MQPKDFTRKWGPGDAAVAAAYGWGDWSASMTDDEILRRLLALNRERSAPTA
jgi:hypothetical protein